MKRRFLKSIAYIFYLLVATLLLLEISYRNYWIDFYEPELCALNEGDLEANDDQPSILAIGDSFTAHPESYIRVLRDSLSDFKIINAGIPGTSAHQNLLALRRRVKQFRPEIIIYQIYVGNDLLEFRHPVSGMQIGTVRGIYWWLSDRIRVLGLLNYRSLSVRNKVYDDLPAFQSENRESDFDPDLYTPRTRLHIKAEPSMVENVIFNKQERSTDVEEYINLLRSKFAVVDAKIPIVFLVVPHSVQVGQVYQDHMRTLGMKMVEQDRLLDLNYPFIASLRQTLNAANHYIANPLPSLQMANEKNSIFYENDPHLTEYGQSSLGRFVWEYLDSVILN